MENIVTMSDMDKQQLNEIRIALEQAIVYKLEKAGIYHRSFSRVKADKSLAGKLATGKYSLDADGKKIQDLIGVRINLFFYEDIKICEKIIEETFKVDNWSRSNGAVNKFEAQKRNCVCVLPSKHVKRLSPNVWEYALDQTFEIQLRTLLFEGWHEIEHDMRYKNKYGRGEKNSFSNLSRVMNSIIANLELCDWSMVEIYDDLAVEQIKNKDWERAFQSKYRLNISAGELNTSIINYFDENPEIASRFYEVDKNDLVEALLRERGNMELTQNHLVYIINKNFVKDEYIDKELLNEQYVKEKSERYVTDISPLSPTSVFSQETYIPENGFMTAVKILYDWAYDHMKNVFNQMPEEPKAGTYETVGYKLIINFDEEKTQFNMEIQQISTIEAGLVWHVFAKISPKAKGLKLTVRNICESATPIKRAYNRPAFMRDIYSQVGILDAGYLVKESEPSMKTNFDTIKELIMNPQRKLPVVLVSKPSAMPSWAVSFDGYVINIKTLKKSLSGICHFAKTPVALIEEAKERGFEFEPGSVLYWKIGETRPQIFDLKTIHESYFEETRHVVSEEYQYEKAFRYLLKEIVREEFLS